VSKARLGKFWWRRVDSNHGPTDYETVALATEGGSMAGPIYEASDSFYVRYVTGTTVSKNGAQTLTRSRRRSNHVTGNALR
jgi:hypothetical protein